MKSVLKTVALFLSVSLMVSCDLIIPDESIHFLVRQVEVDASAQSVTLKATKGITYIAYDCVLTTGCKPLSVDESDKIYTKEDGKTIVSGDWFKLWYYDADPTFAVVELDENLTGEKRQIEVVAYRYAYGTSAVVTQLP